MDRKEDMSKMRDSDESIQPRRTVRLSSGADMPVLGFGVFQITDLAQCTQCVRWAIEDGYRLFDTASAYFNEQAVGEACAQEIKQGTVKREDLFLTTKVWLQDYGNGNTVRSVKRSLQRLGTDYLDLVLLHQPFGKWKEAWQELEELNREGVVRSIGVSNFTPDKFRQLLSVARVRPAVDQIERHPFFAQDRFASCLKKEDVQQESWGALCEGLKDIFQNPVLGRIGAKYGKTAAQTAIRWNIQTGSVALIKSVRPEKIQEDFDVFDFSLTNEEIREIGALDAGHSEIIDLDSPVTERLLMKVHIPA